MEQAERQAAAADGGDQSVEQQQELGQSAVPMLPSGWDAVVSRSTGEVYYLSAAGESTWDFPTVPVTHSRDSGTQQPQPQQPPQQEELLLPSGWEAVTSQSTGDTYYRDTLTGNTTWDFSEVFPTDPDAPDHQPPSPVPPIPGFSEAILNWSILSGSVIPNCAATLS